MVCAMVGGVKDMWSFGNGTFGQLGLSQHLSFQTVERPTMAVQEKGIKKVSCGANHTLALLDSGMVFAWGHNEYGQLGDGQQRSQTNPKHLESLKDWKMKEICCGSNFCLAVADGKQDGGDGVWSWGINDYCQLGHSGDQDKVLEPRKIPEMAGHTVLMLAAGYFHAMCVISNFIKTDKEKSEDYQRRREDNAKKLGKGQAVSKLPEWLKKKAMDPEQKEKMEAKLAKAKKRKEMVRLDAERKLRHREDNELRALYTWGDGGFGQLGHRELYTEAYIKKLNPKATSQLREFTRLGCPRLVESLVGWTTPKELGHIASIKAGGCQSGLLTEKGMLMTWGCGQNGRLGHGNKKNVNVPTPVTGLKTGKTKSDEQKVRDFAIGQYHMMVLTSTRDVFAFGQNRFGQLGLGQDGIDDPTDKLVPTLVKPISKRGGASLYSGDTHAAMITDNGEVFIWGQSQGGRLGLQDVEDEAVHQPQLLDTMAGIEVSSVALGAGHTTALSTQYPADDTIGMQIATSTMIAVTDDDEADIFMSECCIVS